MVQIFEQLYDNLDVVDASQPDWQDQIWGLIGYGEPPTIKPLKSILDMAERLGVKTVVCEREYIDTDFLDEFQNYYCKRFRVFPAKCSRLHFFQKCFAKQELLSRVLAKAGYLGFSVIRPTLSYRTGRTVLRSPKANMNSMFTLCRADFKVNLSGNALSATGMPFIQQDTNVCVCAEAALWMTNSYMHKRYGSPYFRPSQITLAATRSLTVGPVRRGLIPEQVLAALREMGHEPLIFPHYDNYVTSRIIYAYVESELPVTLLIKVGTKGHAVVIIGHDFRTRRNVDKNRAKSNLYWVDRFYIHDDAVGPYEELFIEKPGKGQQLSYSIEDHAAYTVVPVPSAVSMQANDVFDHVDVLMDHLNNLIGHLRGSGPFRFSAMELKGLVFRTYLRSSNLFKTELSLGMSLLFRHCYRALRMPRYIWVTEISRPEYLNKARSRDRCIVGEIIMDSTADRHSAMTSYLAIHLHGRLVIKLPEKEESYGLYVDYSERPYSHLVR